MLSKHNGEYNDDNNNEGFKAVTTVWVGYDWVQGKAGRGGTLSYFVFNLATIFSIELSAKICEQFCT